MKKKIYFRKVFGGGMKILQLVAFSRVFTLSKNTAWWNGEKHNWRISTKSRKLTDL